MKDLVKQLGDHTTEIIIGFFISAILVILISLLADKWGDLEFGIATLLLFIALISAYWSGKTNEADK